MPRPRADTRRAAAARSGPLAAVLPSLRCPHCAEPLAPAPGGAACASGHRFDVARGGHLTLLGPRGRRGSEDTAAMLAARERVLASGLLDPVRDALAEAAAAHAGPPGVVLDVGAGPGAHLAAALERLPDRLGVALDLSAPALRRAARAHPRMAAVGADAWDGLPMVDASAGLVLVVFAPRPLEEIARVLAPGGALLVATPAPEHLAELTAPLGAVRVDPAKAERIARAMPPALVLADRVEVRARRSLGRDALADVLAMGPHARHLDPAAAAAALPEPLEVTVAVDVAVHRRAH